MMQSIAIIRLSDMKPVLEVWAHECQGHVLKSGFISCTSVQWLQAFNAAVKDAGGVQPSPDQIRDNSGAFYFFPKRATNEEFK